MEEQEDIINLKRNTNIPDMFCQEASDDRSSSAASSINSEKNKPAVQPTISVKQLNNFRKQWQGLQARGMKTKRNKQQPQESKNETQLNNQLSVATTPDAIQEPVGSDTPVKLTAQQRLKAKIQNSTRPEPPLVDNYHILASSKEIKGMAARRTVQSSYGVRRHISLHSSQTNLKAFSSREITNCQTVANIRMATYLKSRDGSNHSDLSFVQSFPETKIKLSANVPLQILDGIIGQQERQEGGGVFNRGQKLKRSLINLDRVKNYLKGTNTKKKISAQGLPNAQKLDFMDNSSLDEHVQWRLMMQYFKGNPAALLNALPSPRLPGSLLKEQTRPPVYNEVPIKTKQTEQVPGLDTQQSEDDAQQLTLVVKDAKVRAPIKQSIGSSSQVTTKHKQAPDQNFKTEQNTQIQKKQVKKLPPLKKRNQPAVKSETEPAHSSIDNSDVRHVVQLLDWYHTPIFKKIVLNGEPDPLERSEKYIDTDNVETLISQIKQYRARRGVNCEELISISESKIKACWDTIAYIATEIFGSEAAEIELKGQKASEIYTVTQVPERFQGVQGKKILTLENLVRKVDQLHSLRKDIITYLDTTIKAREKTIQLMRLTVSKITNDDFFYAQTEEGSNDDLTSEKFSPENPRLYMKKLGNQLVEQTEALFRTSKHFLQKVSKHFNHVRVETLIFQEADYVDVACKETEEICAILASYDIYLNVMDLQLIQQK